MVRLEKNEMAISHRYFGAAVNWMVDVLADPSMYPHHSATGRVHKDFLILVRTIATYLSHLFAHLHMHLAMFIESGYVAHLHATTRHFVFFSLKFRLLDEAYVSGIKVRGLVVCTSSRATPPWLTPVASVPPTRVLCRRYSHVSRVSKTCATCLRSSCPRKGYQAGPSGAPSLWATARLSARSRGSNRPRLQTRLCPWLQTRPHQLPRCIASTNVWRSIALARS